jgi:hypothetical protein
LRRWAQGWADDIRRRLYTDGHVEDDEDPGYA